MKRSRCLAITLLLLFQGPRALSQEKVLIPMDLSQTDHLKAYGIAYMALSRGLEIDWLLNYRGGSFMLDAHDFITTECLVRGVAFIRESAAGAASVYAEVQREDNNMDVVRLEKAPRVAVYVPPGFQPWDDAVTLALDYAEIKYDKLWDDEVLDGKLADYDWLHLHHEDFTGQYGKFYASFAGAAWYQAQVAQLEQEARKRGFRKVAELKKAVARAIARYIGAGGFMFAMCSATDTFDIALAAENTDICDAIYDGDPPDPDFQRRLDFSKTLAFTGFTIEKNPLRYEYSDIDEPPSDMLGVQNPETDYFTLFEFSAKFDPVPTMLTQNHVNVIKGFMGQTTGFRKNLIKTSVTILAEKQGTDGVKYLHGNYGRGTFTYYGGHDPEDYQHAVGNPPTDLSLHKNSPGYRLILNNILFPAARKKQQKT